MNKQAITFISLFTLILVLSIYYMMLPQEKTNEVSQQQPSSIEELQIALDKKREDIINENNDLIAKESSTTEMINKALETISQTKNLKDKEKELIELLQKEGYQDVFLEIDNKIVKVTILKKDATQSDANHVIKIILNHIGEQYQVEVKFINE